MLGKISGGGGSINVQIKGLRAARSYASSERRITGGQSGVVCWRGGARRCAEPMNILCASGSSR